jgi:cyclophilin family peptidyl-prolyl cis-trans isomerase
VKRALTIAATVCAVACAPKKSAPTPPDAASPVAASAVDDALRMLALAEDGRRAADVTEDLRTSRDVRVRRRAAEALARIADDASRDGISRALEDDDPETVAWGAYGLGATCRGHEDAYVRALAARSASLELPDAGVYVVDPRFAIARALGRCGGEVAEKMLAKMLVEGEVEAASYALGDVAAKRNALSTETMSALLATAKGDSGAQPNDVALYPFARMKHLAGDPVERLLGVARASLARDGAAASPSRIFAVRALAAAGELAASDLMRVVEDHVYSPAERAEAARGLGTMGRDGSSAAAEALVYLVPDKDPVAIAAFGGDELGVMTTLLAALGGDAPPKADKSLFALAHIAPPPGAAPSLLRRLGGLRCTAAQLLARGSYEADVLAQCDDATSESFERARLAALIHATPMNSARREAWRTLAKTAHLRVREAALEAIGAHRELKDAARDALALALASNSPGLVATAADQIHAHPDRVYVLAKSEIRAALDPHSPEPMSTPARDLDPAVAHALAAAIARPWTDDCVETKIALFEAGLAVASKEGREAALAACRDSNVTLRARAQKALSTISDAPQTCERRGGPTPPAPEIESPLERPTTVRITTDAAIDLEVTFDPTLAPVAATRFVSLARAGFFTNIVVHRVVPGFVVQFGDPGGDGYGGSGKLLPCETSPVPFDALDVGIALAGRDTGSSQLFVTLAPTPHLDGEYTHLGHARGDWAAVAEGDVVLSVAVEP